MTDIGNIALSGDRPREGAIVDVTTANFRQEVMAQSMRAPVLVDFWAPWCGPCKQLAPALEKVARAAGDKVRLVKMNIDEHPDIPGQLGIKSIPAVVAFQKGQPVDGFVGALPESQIKAFIERLVGPIGGEAEELVEAGEAALAAGDAPEAINLFTQALAGDPANAPALAGLARAQLAAGDLAAAEATMAAAAKVADSGGVIAAAGAAVDLARQAEKVGDFDALEKKIAADPTDFQARFDLAIALNAAGRREDAANALLEIIRRNRSWNDEAARKQLLQFFEAWGHMEPESVAARRQLSGILFS